MVKSQIVKSSKVSIFNATNRDTGCPIAGAHAGTAATKGDATGKRTTHRTAPIGAVGTDKAERTTTADVAAARHGQF